MCASASLEKEGKTLTKTHTHTRISNTYSDNNKKEAAESDRGVKPTNAYIISVVLSSIFSCFFLFSFFSFMLSRESRLFSGFHFQALALESKR